MFLRFFTCRAFAFRYSGASSVIGSTSTNCEMSDRDLRMVFSTRPIEIHTLSQVDGGRDTVRDRDWDLFTRTRYSGECRGALDSFQTSPILADRLSCYIQYRTDTTFRGRAVVETEQVRKLDN